MFHQSKHRASEILCFTSSCSHVFPTGWPVGDPEWAQISSPCKHHGLWRGHCGTARPLGFLSLVLAGGLRFEPGQDPFSHSLLPRDAQWCNIWLCRRCHNNPLCQETFLEMHPWIEFEIWTFTWRSHLQRSQAQVTRLSGLRQQHTGIIARVFHRTQLGHLYIAYTRLSIFWPAMPIIKPDPQRVNLLKATAVVFFYMLDHDVNEK